MEMLSAGDRTCLVFWEGIAGLSCLTLGKLLISCYCQQEVELWCFTFLLEVWQEEHNRSPRAAGAACPAGQPAQVEQPGSPPSIVLCRKASQHAWGTESFLDFHRLHESENTLLCTAFMPGGAEEGGRQRLDGAGRR